MSTQVSLPWWAMNINDVHRSAIAAAHAYGRWSPNPVEFQEVLPVQGDGAFAAIFVDRRDGVSAESRVFQCDVVLSHFADPQSLTEHLRQRIGLHLRRAD